VKKEMENARLLALRLSSISITITSVIHIRQREDRNLSPVLQSSSASRGSRLYNAHIAYLRAARLRSHAYAARRGFLVDLSTSWLRDARERRRNARREREVEERAEKRAEKRSPSHTHKNRSRHACPFAMSRYRETSRGRISRDLASPARGETRIESVRDSLLTASRLTNDRGSIETQITTVRPRGTGRISKVGIAMIPEDRPLGWSRQARSGSSRQAPF